MSYAMGAYRLQPGDPRVMDTLAFVLLKNDKPADAAVLLTKAHKLLPEVKTIMLHLAMAKIQLGEKNVAIKLLQQVVDQGEGDEVAQARALMESLQEN
jgi:FimV-like protein